MLEGVEICKLSITVWFSRKGARGTIVKFPVRQLLFIQSRRCFSVTMVSCFQEFDKEYIEELMAKGDNENKTNSTQWWKKVLKMWANERANLEEYENDVLYQRLSHF